MRIQVQIDYTVQETPEEVKSKFTGAKDWEVLDQDGDRYGFADSEVDAVDQLSSFIYDLISSGMLGLITLDGEHE